MSPRNMLLSWSPRWATTSVTMRMRAVWRLFLTPSGSGTHLWSGDPVDLSLINPKAGGHNSAAGTPLPEPPGCHHPQPAVTVATASLLSTASVRNARNRQALTCIYNSATRESVKSSCQLSSLLQLRKEVEMADDWPAPHPPQGAPEPLCWAVSVVRSDAHMGERLVLSLRLCWEDQHPSWEVSANKPTPAPRTRQLEVAAQWQPENGR